MIKAMGRVNDSKIQEAYHLIGGFVVCTIGFFIGRGVIEGISPMLIAYFVACYDYKKMRIWIFITILLGMVSSLMAIDIIRYVGILILFSVVGSVLQWVIKERVRPLLPLIGAVSTLIGGIVFLKLPNFQQGSIARIGIETSIVFFLSILFNKGIRTIMNDHQEEIDKEQFLSFALIALMTTMGVLGLHMLDFSLMQIIALNLILYLGYQYGVEASAVIGVGIGFATLFAAETPFYPDFILWSVLGIVAGIFRELGKVGCISAYVISYLLLNYFFGSEPMTIQSFELLFVTGGIFLILPVKKKEKKVIQTIEESEVEKIIYHKLKAFAKTYDHLAKTFVDFQKNRDRLSSQEINQLIEQLASKVCKECSMCNHCWEKDFYNTYKTIYSVLSAVESRGEVLEADIPQEFIEHCGKVEQFVVMTNRLFDIYKTNLRWENRINEQREIFAEQYQHISEIINGLSDQMTEDKLEYMELLNRYQDALDKEKQTIIGMHLGKLNTDQNEIVIDVRDNWDTEKVRELLRVINRVDHRKYQIKEVINNNKTKTKRCVFSAKDRYRFVKGHSKLNKKAQDVSGDSYTMLDLENGIDLIALSDGMGSGDKAFMESQATVEMLEQMIEGGFDLKVAIKTINAVLGIRNNYQAFSTLDISMFNRLSGECRFIKNGAVTTYIKRDHQVELIHTETLPLGMLKDVDPVMVTRNLKADDIIVMMSDGISDLEARDENSNWIENLLLSLDSLNPQRIADEIIDSAKEKCGGEIGDDMTVLVFRVWERATNSVA